ncbi:MULTISPECIES: hypothetical protein [Bifidobacterium]|uniref:hypothetical protein n=1 Tax=Bifidobacterium TaxID=1678 RepID=UPI00290D749F|nr:MULTISPECIES: hypothetical protein [Bifidobacterium]MDU5888268.1 hypothetical protein [Bifidobacterium scardovii]
MTPFSASPNGVGARRAWLAFGDVGFSGSVFYAVASLVSVDDLLCSGVVFCCAWLVLLLMPWMTAGGLFRAVILALAPFYINLLYIF